MAIKVALLVIAALIAVAAAYPRATVASEFDCNEDTSYEVTVKGILIRMNICTHRNVVCIKHTPLLPLCPPVSYVPPHLAPRQCTDFRWYISDEELNLLAHICQGPYSSLGGLCLLGSRSTMICELIGPDLIWGQVEQTEAPEDDVEICEIIDGFKQCRSLSEGKKAKVSQVADCFCATDEDSGNKVCIPDNCDEAFGNRPVV